MSILFLSLSDTRVISFEEVIETNIKKLEKRYPGGQFDIYYSENRAEGDR